MNFDNVYYDTEIVTDFIQILGEYSFRLERIPEIEIKIKLYQYIGSNDVCFETSHYIRTPEQCGPYITNVNYAGSQEAALERAIHTITDFYKSGIDCGHEPSPDWLIENTLY